MFSITLCYSVTHNQCTSYTDSCSGTSTGETGRDQGAMLADRLSYMRSGANASKSDVTADWLKKWKFYILNGSIDWETSFYLSRNLISNEKKGERQVIKDIWSTHFPQIMPSLPIFLTINYALKAFFAFFIWNGRLPDLYSTHVLQANEYLLDESFFQNILIWCYISIFRSRIRSGSNTTERLAGVALGTSAEFGQ